MPISHSHKLIFIHIPKNAGTSITTHFKMEDIGHHLWQYYYQKYKNYWGNYKKISISRNPWDRVVSCYEYAKLLNSYWHSVNGKSKEGKHLDYELLKNKSFEECINILKENPHQLKHQGWRNQHHYIFNGNNSVIDNIIKIENLNKELSILLDKSIEVPRINMSNNKNYKSYYKNKEMIEVVRDLYKKDIEFFNYEF